MVGGGELNNAKANAPRHSPALTIIVDSREQKPLAFLPYSQSFNKVVDTLYAADYGCRWQDGTEMPLMFERKSISDLFGTLTKGIERFKRELQRAKDAGLKLVLIIEGSIADVLKGTEYSKVRGESIVKTVFTLWVKYDLFPVFCKDRKEMEHFITESFSAIARNYSPTLGGARETPTEATHPSSLPSPATLEAQDEEDGEEA